MLLELQDIHASYHKDGGLFKRAKKHRILKGVSLGLHQGECLALVGESGSGKSTLGKVIIGSKKPDSGKVLFEGKDLYAKDGRKSCYGSISVVFQDYTSSVNPFFTVRSIIAEPLRAVGCPVEDKTGYIVDLLEQVGLSGDYLDRHPHELSGGQLQRVCIARAVSTRPKMILLDEAVSSLDVSVSVQILDLLKKLQEQYSLSYFFITHDMTVVTYICDRVLFFNNGKVVEEAPTLADLHSVKDPYSKELLHAAASLDWLAADIELDMAAQA